jgi:hypothetical protein
MSVGPLVRLSIRQWLTDCRLICCHLQCKQWYTIPPKFASQFERVCQGLFPIHFKKCPEFLRHKVHVVHRHLRIVALLKFMCMSCFAGICCLSRYFEAPQHSCAYGDSGRTRFYDYISTRISCRFQLVRCARSVHCALCRSSHLARNQIGVYSGFNCAESVNFATENWIEVFAQTLQFLAFNRFHTNCSFVLLLCLVRVISTGVKRTFVAVQPNMMVITRPIRQWLLIWILSHLFWRL